MVFARVSGSRLECYDFGIVNVGKWKTGGCPVLGFGQVLVVWRF